MGLISYDYHDFQTGGYRIMKHIVSLGLFQEDRSRTNHIIGCLSNQNSGHILQEYEPNSARIDDQKGR